MNLISKQDFLPEAISRCLTFYRSMLTIYRHALRRLHIFRIKFILFLILHAQPLKLLSTPSFNCSPRTRF